MNYKKNYKLRTTCYGLWLSVARLRVCAVMTSNFAILLSFALVACSAVTSTPVTEVAGTWGGDNAGLIVDKANVHVHIGCTVGDAVGPIRPDPDGRFVATGTYNVDAYPVDRGIIHPASFTGRIVGDTMTLSVTLTDNGRALGPVTLVYGKEPTMGPCPICRVPRQ